MQVELKHNISVPKTYGTVLKNDSGACAGLQTLLFFPSEKMGNSLSGPKEERPSSSLLCSIMSSGSRLSETKTEV